MKVPVPQYLLFSEASGTDGCGRWRFLLRSADGSQQFEATDVEPGVQGERLDLLTVVRALEWLDQPSRITLIGCSRYVRQGMQYGLSEWPSNGWKWESFGQLVPIKNGDLWQRMDRALRFHRVECCRRRFDLPHAGLPELHAGLPEPIAAEPATGEAAGVGTRIRVLGQGRLRYRVSLPRERRWRISALLRLWRRRAARSWTALRHNFSPRREFARRYA